MRKRILTILIIGFLFLPSFNFGQDNSTFLPSVPETLEEGINFLKKIIKELPGLVIKIWKEDILPLFKKIFNKINIWSKIENSIKKEIEKRKEIFKEELKKETPKIEKFFREDKRYNIVRHF